ncbi:MarR family transcriptional regulator [Natrinema versiforme]|uniref:Uncharacterized protein n=1 Tax=Natrinema versiforme JCM 10478 TaxID=1227496 RepID=L9Y573_9EURY|nr:helix-turn-helix domain-containing protein [Natrinema versiforme]ELY68877.1 hypothetical protein C489_05908 [Natrinema versiforme JCM 10478]
MTDIQTAPKHIHHIAVTSDDDRPLLPITREHIGRDAAVLYPIGDDQAGGIDRYQRVLEDFLGLSVTVTDEIHDADGLYAAAYRRLRDDLEHHDAVYVNPTALETRAAHLFTTAAQTLALERPGDRSHLSAYTVDRHDEPRTLPLAPDGDPDTETEHRILGALAAGSDPPSVSDLARSLADGDCDESFRSKVQYNVQKLEEKGYLERIDAGHTLRPRLSPMGRLWTRANSLDMEETA